LRFFAFAGIVGALFNQFELKTNIFSVIRY
jgi:hypothetical protein